MLYFILSKQERMSVLKVFDIENPVWSTFSKILDVIILNVLFLLCCIPVITIGSSVTALYFTAMRLVSGNVTYVTRDFFRSFKQNFKQSLVTELIVFDAGVILAVFTYLCVIVDSYMGKVVFIVGDILFAAVLTYVFPALAKFNVSTKKLFYNSAVMAVVHFPFTILNVGILFLAGVFAYYNFGARMILLVFGVAAIAVLQSLWFNYIFAKYMTKEELEENEFYREEERRAKQEKKAAEKKVKR